MINSSMGGTFLIRKSKRAMIVVLQKDPYVSSLQLSTCTISMDLASSSTKIKKKKAGLSISFARNKSN